VELELRSRLADELSAGPEPPIGDVVDAAVRRGRRLRVARRLRVGAAALLTLAVAAGLVAGGAALGPVLGPAQGPVRVQVATAADPLVPATAAGLLVLLESLLPSGVTSGFAGAKDGLTVQVFLDTGRGPGMLRVSVGTDAHGAAAAVAGGEVTGPVPRKDGSKVTVAHLRDSCVQRTVVLLYRPDGIVVQVNIAACLGWDAGPDPTAPQVLTAVQAEAVAADPRWGTLISRSLVDEGAVRHPDLPELA
jgi:hypothetical protein